MIVASGQLNDDREAVTSGLTAKRSLFFDSVLRQCARSIFRIDDDRSIR